MENGNANNVVRKGFRQPSKPTKGQVQQENQTLAGELQGKVQMLTQQLQYLSNMISQVIQGVRSQAVDINALSVLESANPIQDVETVLGDHIMIDYFGRLVNEDGTTGDAFEGGYGTNYAIIGLGNDTLIPGFESQLMGMKVGDIKTIDVTFPENYGNASLAKKAARFDVQVKKIYKSITHVKVQEIKAEYDKMVAEKKVAAEAAAQATVVESATISQDIAPKSSTPETAS